MDKIHQNAIALDIKNTWERVYSVLITASRRLGNRDACHRLPELPQDQRAGFVVQQWGPIALQKVEAFLARINQLENEASGEIVQQQPAQGPAKEQPAP